MRAEIRRFMKEMKAAAFTLLGSTNPELEKFGFKPEKARRKLTGEELAVRAAKSRATREKRGTKGKRQKEAVKGEVKSLTIVPPDARTTA